MKSGVEIKCLKCKDFGRYHPLANGVPDYSKTVVCECQREILKRENQIRYMKYCELPAATEDRTFETFKCDKEGRLKEALHSAHQIVWGQLRWLTLISDVDRGKTHLAIAICRQWLADGQSAKYAFVPLLLDELRDGFNNKGENSYEFRFNFYLHVGLLVLDDLGAEAKTAWSLEKLETIIDYRYINDMATVITSNKTLDELNEISPRIRSRILRANMSKVVNISAPEYITLNKNRR